MPNPAGRPEQSGNYQDGIFKWHLKIKPEASFQQGLGSGSYIPRFDAKLKDGGKYYINPFTKQIGTEEIGTHLPLNFPYY
ncbi:MAG: hypothetical protein K2X08_08565 [Chlamydiales bacterium]|nr:hypothetical protein [Chlamydiales bacterium]